MGSPFWNSLSYVYIYLSLLFRDMIMDCMDDEDDSIRLRALDLISGMVSKKTLVEIVKKMLLHCDESESAS